MMIRKSTANDIDIIMDIWLRTNIKAHSFIPAEYWESHFNEVKAAILEAEVYVYEDTAIKGFVGLIENYIAGIFVKEEFQSQGIGKALIQYLQNCKSELVLNVYEENRKAVDFYTKHNFAISEKKNDEETNHVEYQMIWTREPQDDYIFNNLVEETLLEKIQILFADDYSGHDYFHTERVYKNAMRIAEQIPCDKRIVALAALLHDVDDPKIFSTTDYENARCMMNEIAIPQELAEKVILIINSISFRGTGKTVPDSVEGKIVQDADRLDAIGAIGIARAFAYGGSHNRIIYDSNELPKLPFDETDNRNTTIHHFYEKLLRLKDLMNTDIAKELAEARTKVMQDYLEQFMKEWNGKA